MLTTGRAIRIEVVFDGEDEEETHSIRNFLFYRVFLDNEDASAGSLLLYYLKRKRAVYGYSVVVVLDGRGVCPGQV